MIKTDFWDDEYILNLSSLEKTAFLYLFTNYKVNMVGIYKIPDRTICYTLGATLGELQEIKEKFEKDLKYIFYKSWVYILNYAQHNKFSTAENILNTYKREYNEIPKDVRDYFFNKVPFVSTYKEQDIVKDIDMDIDIDMDSTLGGRVGGRVGFEAKDKINVNEIPDFD